MCLVFRLPSQGNVPLERGKESRLVIDNVTYDYQGEYECRANNFINGQERSTTSDPISLQVVGAPQVLRPNSSGYQVSVKRGESASLTLVVCADPRPRHVAWEWGSLRLEAGAGIGKKYLLANIFRVTTRKSIMMITRNLIFRFSPQADSELMMLHRIIVKTAISQHFTSIKPTSPTRDRTI